MNDFSKDEGIELPALNGDNPLGFLAALGVVAALHQTGEREIQLSWKRNFSWTPSVSGFVGDKDVLVEKLAFALKGRTVSEEARKEEQKAKKASDQAKKKLRDKENEIKKRKLKGKERELAREEEIEPLEKDRDKLRNDWLVKRKEAVPSPELVLGKRPDCKEGEYRSFAEEFLGEADGGNRLVVDMLASFGSDAVVAREANDKKKGNIEPTPFCFITGSGHQWFLDTARDLANQTTMERLRKVVLFDQWTYEDEKLSMRWDPLDDRRYALMNIDPSDSKNKSRTVWIANLLAYRALALFPSAPVKRQLKTTGWIRLEESKKKRNVFTWPIWENPIGVETIRSLLQHSELAQKSPSLEKLMPLGVCAYFRSERIQVGQGINQKTNFSPASPSV